MSQDTKKIHDQAYELPGGGTLRIEGGEAPADAVDEFEERIAQCVYDLRSSVE